MGSPQPVAGAGRGREGFRICRRQEVCVGTLPNFPVLGRSEREAGQGVVVSDPTESARRQRLTELNVKPGSRGDQVDRVGQDWDTQQLTQDFEVIGFLAPRVVVRRKADGVKGSLEFQSSPRLYFNSQAHDESR